jgi:hypothetical protein
MSLNIGILSSAYKAAAPSGNLLLDLYPNAAVAFSLRKLRTAYTGSCIRVRRSSDNTETDIGFFANVLDIASLLTFCGAANGFVSRWYDQSENGNNGLQTTNTLQSQIVNTGVLITKNSKPTCYFVPSVEYSLITTINGTSGTLLNVSSTLFSPPNVTNGAPIGRLTSSNDASHQPWVDGTIYENFASTIRRNSISVGVNTTNLYLYNCISAASFYNIKVNNVTRFNSATNTVGFGSAIPKIGLTSSTSFGNFTFYGNISEIIVYTSNQNANISAINTNINSFYTLY